MPAHNNRDDFSPQTKQKCALRSGFICSFAGCGAHTVGPSDESNEATSNVGVACHIAAAASGPGARRYDPTMTSEQRSSINNAIYMCQTHAKLIDTDEVKYSTPLLLQWKVEAERRAQQRIGQPQEERDEPLRIDAAASVYVKTHQAIGVIAELSNLSDKPNTIRHVYLTLDGISHEARSPRSGFYFDGCSWLPAQGLRIEPWGAVSGAWFFGWSFDGGGENITAKPGQMVEIRIEATRGNPFSAILPLLHPDDPASPPPANRSTAVEGLNGPAEHDRQIFKKLDGLLPEAFLKELMDKLQTDDAFASSQLTRCLVFVDECDNAGSQYLDPTIRLACGALSTALTAIAGFMTSKFFRFPENQISSDPQLA